MLELTGISKRFGATQALREVDLVLHAGEVHVLAGENGAGKSTLINILAGAHQPDVGTLRVGGEARRLKGVGDSQALGIATIHQELSLVGSMTVCDNLHLGLPGRWLAPLRTKRRLLQAQRWLARVGLDIPADTPVEQWSLAVRQRIEIARALRTEPRVIVLDEPTSALPTEATEALLALVEQLKQEGCAMLYVSHRSAELERLADHVSVLRDGQVVFCEPAHATTFANLGALMAGNDQPLPSAVPSHSETKRPLTPTTQALHANGFHWPTRGPAPDSAVRSLAIQPGEIVGLAGLEGSGCREWLQALVGIGAARVQQLSVAGLELQSTDSTIELSPQRCIAANMILLSGDRSLSVFPALSVRDNAGLSSLSRWSHWQWLQQRELNAATAKLAEQLQLSTPSLTTACAALSGGNQQKVALIRSLLCQPKVLLLDDATRGIDVRAKRQVHQCLQRVAADGTAVLMTSSDTAELVACCSRVVVLVAGSIVGELSGPALTRQAIVSLAATSESAA